MLHVFFVDSTALGLRVKDGVVLAVEKIIQSKLLTPGANRRIQSGDFHIGVVCPSAPYPLPLFSFLGGRLLLG